MWPSRRGYGLSYLFFGLLIAGWIGAYVALPRMSPLDGPFSAEPFNFDASGLPFISKTELKIFGFKVFVLESRENLGAAPGTVFLLKNSDGTIRWTRLSAPELGFIRLEEASARWFLPGGWVIHMKPEYTGSGEMYVSPFGNFRFFFHRW
ncbi:MAG: hypothetical protein ACREO9_09500 [Lysobacterales bacterium]